MTLRCKHGVDIKEGFKTVMLLRQYIATYPPISILTYKGSIILSYVIKHISL